MTLETDMNQSLSADFLSSTVKLFRYYKTLGEKALKQVPEDQWHHTMSEDGNSLAVLVKHLWGNMLSRWTNFLTEDGEKPWRMRDEEFEEDAESPDVVMNWWEEGWKCLFNALESLQPDDLGRTVYIRNEGHTVMEAIHRQLAHYSYHVGQMVFAARIYAGTNWQSLSIPRKGSSTYNAERFSNEKERKHFTDEV